MRISTFVGIALSVSVLAACSGSGGGSGGGDAAVKPTDVQNHKSAECPSLDGEYTLKDQTKRIKTSKVENGISLDDSEVISVVDGKSHTLEGNASLSYVGTCSKNVISLDLSEGSKLLGKMEYSQNDQAQLIIEMKVNDSRLGESGKEVWDKKKN